MVLALTDLRALSEGWLSSTRSASAFDAMLPFMRRIPLRSHMLRIVSGIDGASSVVEGSVKPISVISIGATDDVLQKSAATVIATEELLRLPEASALLDAELQLAVIAASIKVFSPHCLRQRHQSPARAARSPT